MSTQLALIAQLRNCHALNTCGSVIATSMDSFVFDRKGNKLLIRGTHTHQLIHKQTVYSAVINGGQLHNRDDFKRDCKKNIILNETLKFHAGAGAGQMALMASMPLLHSEVTGPYATESKINTDIN